jgi:hypothetical protein
LGDTTIDVTDRGRRAFGIAILIALLVLPACETADADPGQPPPAAPAMGSAGSPPSAPGAGAVAGGAAGEPAGGAAGEPAGGAAGEPSGGVNGGATSADCGDLPSDYFAPTCTFVVCHDGQSGNALDLVAPGLPQRLVGTVSASLACAGFKYIDADTPEQSLILRKLDPNPPCGDRMPPAAMASPRERACVLQWIEAAVGNAAQQ